MKRLEKCPKCGSSLKTVWTKGRMLKQECRDDGDDLCNWEGKPYTPEKKPVRSVKTVPTDDGCWVYEGFDQYGHTFVYSQGFNSKAACIEAARKDVRRTSQDPHMGKCVAIVWPPTAQVRGVRVT